MGSMKVDLQDLLEKRGKTLWEFYRELSKEIHVDVNTIREWTFSGDRMPSRDNIKKLAKYFNVHPAYLEYGIDNEAIKIIEELQKYEPETFEKLKQIMSIIYEINKEKREKAIKAEKKKWRKMGLKF